MPTNQKPSRETILCIQQPDWMWAMLHSSSVCLSVYVLLLMDPRPTILDHNELYIILELTKT